MDRKCSCLLAFIRWHIRRRGPEYTINSEVHHVLTAAARIFQEAGEISGLPEAQRCFEIVPDVSVGNSSTMVIQQQPGIRSALAPHTVMNLTDPGHIR